MSMKPTRSTMTVLLAGCALAMLPGLAPQAAHAGTHAVYPRHADGDARVTDAFATTRWAEDWSSREQDVNRDDPIDRLKFIPITQDGEVYVSLSGELRLRSNYISNPGLIKGEHQRQDIVRMAGGADLHVGEHLRFYGEVAHVSSSGHNIGTPAGNQHNDLVVQQAFFEATGEAGGLDMGVRVGRQEFYDGSRMLVSQLDNNGVPYTLNGVRAWARSETARIDFFDLRPTEYGRGGWGDDRTDNSTRFSGATIGIKVPTDALGGSKLYVDPFIWRLRRRNATWLTDTGREERMTLGAHVWGDVGPLKIDWVADHQFGTFDGRDISAWHVMLDQTVPTGLGPLVPRAGFAFDYASGGGGGTTGKMRNAYTPYGVNTPFSHHLFMTGTNVVSFSPKVEMRPVKPVRLIAEYELVWRASDRDAVYRPFGRVLARTADVRGHKIGELPRLELQWAISPRVSIVSRYEHVFAGPALKRAGYGDSDFLAGWISFRF